MLRIARSHKRWMALSICANVTLILLLIFKAVPLAQPHRWAVQPPSPADNIYHQCSSYTSPLQSYRTLTIESTLGIDNVIYRVDRALLQPEKTGDLGLCCKTSPVVLHWREFHTHAWFEIYSAACREQQWYSMLPHDIDPSEVTPAVQSSIQQGDSSQPGGVPITALQIIHSIIVGIIRCFLILLRDSSHSTCLLALIYEAIVLMRRV